LRRHGLICLAILLAVSFISDPISSEEIRGQVATGDCVWNAQNFGGFYYDIDKNLGTEKLQTTITEGNKLSEPNGVTYTTTAQRNYFEFEDWGYYNIIGFLGKKYFAGYAEDENLDYGSMILFRESVDENSLADEQLQTILIDSDIETIVTAGAPLKLAEGYVLAIKYIDSDGMLLELTKNGVVVDSKVLMPSKDDATMADKTYLYSRDEGEQKGLAIIAVHFKNALTIGNQTVATVNGIWQISDAATEVKVDSEYGKMRIASISPDTITMDNKDYSITLGRNNDIPLVGDIKIKTADQDNIDEANPLRYYIYLDDRCAC
jgi:S-layer protein (TIGR01567 family)